MPLVHGRPVFYHFQFLTQSFKELELDIHGEDVFEYYVSWPLKNVITVHVWSKRIHLDALADERREDFRIWKQYSIMVDRQCFHILLPRFMQVYTPEGINSNNIKIMKLMLIHDRCQEFTRILTAPSKIFNGPQRPNFSASILIETVDDDENGEPKIIVKNRKGRIFFMTKGLLNLVLYCSHGISEWVDTIKIKKIDKKRDKKEK